MVKKSLGPNDKTANIAEQEKESNTKQIGKMDTINNKTPSSSNKRNTSVTEKHSLW